MCLCFEPVSQTGEMPQLAKTKITSGANALIFQAICATVARKCLFLRPALNWFSVRAANCYSFNASS